MRRRLIRHTGQSPSLKALSLDNSQYVVAWRNSYVYVLDALAAGNGGSARPGGLFLDRYPGG
jgi:hypothetical protein